MKRILRQILSFTMVVVLLLCNAIPAYATSITANLADNEKVLYTYSGDITIVITEEKNDHIVIYREYHDGVMVDSVTEGIPQYEEIASIVSTYANPSNSTPLGSVYYDVQGYSREIRMDLSYKLNGSARNTTYTIRTTYGTILELTLAIVSALYTPQIVASKIANALINAGILAIVEGGLARITSSTLSAVAQDEYLYAYVPLQAPDQAEVSKTFSGTTYIINETNSVYEDEIFYSGYTSAGWGKSEMGVNLGNSFFTNYNTVDRWVRS